MSSYGSIAQMASIVADSVLLQDDATGNGNGTPMDITGYATSVLRVEASVPMAGGTTVYFEISVDATNWVPLMGAQVGTTTTGTSTTTEGEWVFSVAGFQEIRARIGDYGSGTVTVAGYASVLAGAGAGSTGAVTQSGTWAVQVLDSAGSNKASVSAAGAVKVDASNYTIPVSGTFWQATQPVSDANLALAQDSTTSGQVGPLVQAAVSTSAPSYTNNHTSPLSLTTGGALRVDSSASTQPMDLVKINGAAPSVNNGAAGTGVLRVTIANDSTGQVSIAGTAAVNVSQVNGVTTSVGNGASGTGVQRVTIANDSTGQVAIAGTAAVNVSQVNGVTTSVGNGASGTGVQRVTIANDSTGQVAIAGTAGVNLSQINGNTTSAGNGTAGTGCQRVTVASDNTPFPTIVRGDAKGGTGAANCTVSSVDSDHNALDVYVRGGTTSSSNIAQINGTTVSQGNGTAGNGCQRVTIASDNTAFPTIVRGDAKGGTGAANCTVSSVDSDHNALDVYIRGGGSSGGNPIAPGTTVTYMSSDAQFTPGSSATDIWTMFGSGTKTVKIYYIGLHYSGNASGLATFFLLRRSSTNSGGTSSTTTPTKMDSNNGSATCTITTYTANPSSLGTGAGQLAVFGTNPFGTGFSATMVTYGPTEFALFDYRLLGQPLVLRGTSEGVVLNCNGTSPTGGTVKISMRVVFTEE
ncbi:MAG: hypothetical protein K2W95_36330 [Candidatus Obscuribacterales bacterium]|nr:hypothetical protein [Candidatus Obscuribacterales bacterium]